MFTLIQTDEFSAWLKELKDFKAKVRILARLTMAEQGNFGDSEPVGEGVSEMRIHIGAGYRVYYKRSDKIIYIVLNGGDKSTQDKDIKRAKEIAGEI